MTVLCQSFRSAGRAFTLRLNQFRTKKEYSFILLPASLSLEHWPVIADDTTMNSSIACRYPRWDSFEGRVLRTADFAWSRFATGCVVAMSYSHRSNVSVLPTDSSDEAECL